MAEPLFGGLKTGKIPVDSFISIYVGNGGTPFTGATGSGANDSTLVYIRESASIEMKPVAIKDTINREFTKRYDVEVKLSLLQATMAEALNWWLLSTTFTELALKYQTTDGSTYWLNLINNAGGQDAVNPAGTSPATGSSWTSCQPTITYEDDKVTIALVFKARMWENEVLWMTDAANNNALATVTQTATALGLTAMSKNRANIRRPGFADPAGVAGGAVLIAGNGVGNRLKGTKVIFTGMSSWKEDYRMRGLCNRIGIKAEFVANQFGPDLAAGINQASISSTLKFNAACADAISFTAGTMPINPTALMDEKMSNIKYAGSVELPYPNWAASALGTVDWGATTPGLITVDSSALNM